MTNDTNTPTDAARELTDAELEAVAGGKPRGSIERERPNAYGGTTSESYRWRGFRFRPRGGI